MPWKRQLTWSGTELISSTTEKRKKSLIVETVFILEYYNIKSKQKDPCFVYSFSVKRRELFRVDNC